MSTPERPGPGLPPPVEPSHGGWSGEPEPDPAGSAENIPATHRYTRGGLVGRGGMGRVYVAEDHGLGREVALKELDPSLKDVPRAVRRLAREAWITARLDHPSIVAVHDIGTLADGRPFYTMRLVKGRSLARALEVGRLGTVYTVSRGGAVVIVWPASIVLFGEDPVWTATAGTAVVLAGLALSSVGSTRGGNRSHRAGLGWAIASALSIAGYHLAYKAALREGANPSATFALSLGLAAVINVVRIGGPGRAVLRTVLRARFARIALMGIVCGGSFLILMEALARGGSGYVLTLRNTSVLFAAGLAFVVGERPTRGELVGAALVAAGAVLMSL